MMHCSFGRSVGFQSLRKTDTVSASVSQYHQWSCIIAQKHQWSSYGCSGLLWSRDGNGSPGHLSQGQRFGSGRVTGQSPDRLSRFFWPGFVFNVVKNSRQSVTFVRTWFTLDYNAAYTILNTFEQSPSSPLLAFGSATEGRGFDSH